MGSIASLNPMTASGSLFEGEDCGDQYEFAELTIPHARGDRGAESTPDGR